MRLPKYAAVLIEGGSGGGVLWLSVLMPADCAVHTRAQICVTLPLLGVEK
jgi:hypothetical protein